LQRSLIWQEDGSQNQDQSCCCEKANRLFAPKAYSLLNFTKIRVYV
jgi:hypothetical protein